MTKVIISAQKTVYNKNTSALTNNAFSSFVPPVSNETPINVIPTVDEFFNNYDVLFFQIPQTGSNSHETLVEKSSEYLGLDLNLLVEQINFLQEQNKQLQKQIDEFNTNM